MLNNCVNWSTLRTFWTLSYYGFGSAQVFLTDNCVLKFKYFYDEFLRQVVVLIKFLRALIMQRMWKVLHTFVSDFSIKFKGYFLWEECIGTLRITSIFFFGVFMCLGAYNYISLWLISKIIFVWMQSLGNLEDVFCLVGVVALYFFMACCFVVVVFLWQHEWFNYPDSLNL